MPDPNREPIIRPRVNRVEPTEHQKMLRTIGFGVKPDEEKIKAAGLGAIGVGGPAEDLLTAVKESVKCPLMNMPIIESSTGTFNGPMLDSTLTRLFTDKIKPFSWTENTDGVDFLDTTLAQNGTLQTPTLVCAVGWHLMPDPIHLAMAGNSWTHPANAAAFQPASPDVFTANDIALLGLGEGQNMEPATLLWGTWASYANWQQARGFHLRWMVGQHTNIFDEQLRNVAYTPTNAQEGSASDSQIDTMFLISRANARYDALGTAQNFLPFSHIRVGAVVGGGAGRFRPARPSDLASVTYGGIDLRKLLDNKNEYRKLALPYFLNAGIPIGLFAQESNGVEADIMRAYMSITYSGIPGLGSGTIPATITPDANILPGFTTGLPEPLLDAAPPASAAQVINIQRRMYKGGEEKVGVHLKGFEVNDDWYQTLLNNSALRDAFLCECGCGWARG